MLSLFKLFVYTIGLFNNTNYDYNNYINKYNKTYNETKYLFFRKNIEYINHMNNKNLSFNLDLNQFTDNQNGISMKNIIFKDECYNCFYGNKDKVYKSIDWRKIGVVTNVKNQGECGSCWSFSSTGSIEGINAIKYKKLHNASEQQLMDCSVREGNKGCQGGLMDNSFKYVIQNKGLCSEMGYPYKAEESFCKSFSCNNVVNIDDYSDIKPNDENILMRAVSQQPVSVAIQANLSSFKFYKSGIYQDDDCGNQLDHGVLIVGYGRDDLTDLDYWIVKNSWTSNWGENGYIRILRNYKKSISGMCGIAMQPSIPLITVDKTSFTTGLKL
jgi:C1A family cysteine protease